MIPGMHVDSQDRVYVFNRTPNVVYVLDSNGNFLNMWGQDRFVDYVLHRPHGLYIGVDQRAYLTDLSDHTVRKFTLDGTLLLTLGAEGKPGEPGEPFRRPADVAISGSGEIFVADGYDNSRVHKFSSDGELLKSWGKKGKGPGEFNLPHGIWVDKDDYVWVTDRENNRIQIFSAEGSYVRQLTHFVQPSEVFIDADDIVYVPEISGRMSIMSMDGQLLARWGGEKSFLLEYVSKVQGDFISYRDIVNQVLKAPGKFVAAHTCCVDSKGDLYVGEATTGQRLVKYIRKS